MNGVALHPTPRWRDVVVEETRIAGLGLRPVGLVIAAALAVGTLAIARDLVLGGPGFDSTETLPTMVIAFFAPFAVWRREPLFGPNLLWTFPVERRRLALARVIAGFAWLMAAVAVLAAWLFVMAVVAGAGLEHHVLRIPLVETVAAYLFGSAFVLGLRHPVRWLLGAVGVLFLTGNLDDVLAKLVGPQSLTGSQELFLAALGDAWMRLPEPARPAAAASLLLGAGLAALWAALLRHRERRRR